MSRSQPAAAIVTRPGALTGLSFVAALALTGTALGNPPPPSPFPIPDVHVLRITDVGPIPQRGPLPNAIMFEVMNWTDTPAYGVELVLNVATGVTGDSGGFNCEGPAACFGLAQIESGGRPLGDFMGDDANFPPADGTGDPPKVGRANDWTATVTTPTRVVFSTTNNPIPPRDLLGAGDAASACALVPGCTSPAPTIGNVESIDNAIDGTPTGELDNVLDGFVVEMLDLESTMSELELLSFNFFLLDQSGNPIGSFGNRGLSGNAFGFGILNVFSIFPGQRSHGPPIWTRNSRAVLAGGDRGGTIVSNTGTEDPPANLRDMFVQNDVFQVEVGATMTGEFLEPLDNTHGVSENSSLLPPYPVELQSFSVE
ncbi:MAG: hypothetical protein DWQ36_20040 [Acidobacteria bacterium]|nr:MAG: hypothetical protein DWQ30_08325 [Acidobacteriota bacterium]REK03580.1 MAG: hypothetical protein DWQ36_20040 [Acidobacteriota bacterium]